MLVMYWFYVFENIGSVKYLVCLEFLFEIKK